MNSKVLEAAINRTLAYFDIFNFPLTKEELFWYLWQPPYISYDEFVRHLPLPEKFGYYFLPGREEIVEARRRALINSELKLKKARRAAWWIKNVPFVKAIFLCNSVGMETAAPESDIDFFIITAPRRIWLVRFFTNLILKLTGQRVGASKSKDKICLSFYLASDSLNLAGARIAEDDIYLAFWFNFLLPLYDPENILTQILKANGWRNKYLPNLTLSFLPERSGVEKSLSQSMNGQTLDCASNGSARDGKWQKSGVGRAWKKMWEAMWRGAYGDMIEQDTKKMQWMKISMVLKEKAKLKDWGVVIEDNILKFHDQDARQVIRKKWLNKI